MALMILKTVMTIIAVMTIMAVITAVTAIVLIVVIVTVSPVLLLAVLRKHHPLSENRDFSTTEHPIDLRPVCKFKLVRCGPVEKTQSARSVSVYSWWSHKVQG